MKKNILAIDDSLTLREFIHRSLARHSSDFQVTTAKDAMEGLALAESMRPDLILLDFVLPDLKGDEVCRRLEANPATAQLPIVLMSSNPADIKRTEAQYKAVVKTIFKPFTPELLCSIVNYVLRDEAIAAPVQVPTAASKPASAASAEPDKAAKIVPLDPSQTRSNIVLSGDLSFLPLIDVLLGAEQQSLSGVLRVYLNETPIETYWHEGRPLMITSRDVGAYLNQTTHRFTAEQSRGFEDARKAQEQLGLPVFFSFSGWQLMSIDDAVEEAAEHGFRLFGQAWAAPRGRVEFEILPVLPGFLAGHSQFDGGVAVWAMETLRRVGDEYLSAMAWGEPNGIPAYTRRGYERIQQIPLNDEEIAFASLLSPTATLADIARGMGVPVESAQRVLYRFLMLQILDYWPAILLRAA